MLAILYLVTMVALGDFLCRRAYRFRSVPHRLATAFIVGLVFSTWFTYLVSLLFGEKPRPLIYGDLAYFAVSWALLFRFRGTEPLLPPPRPPGSRRLDMAFVAAFFVFASWLMFSTLSFHQGAIVVAGKVVSDFGPNLSIAQSFALGHNFPTEYPHYPGVPIHYHFLYYFQVGNLSFLGLPLPYSLNVLSIFSLTSMCILVMTLGEILFDSRAVGRLGASLFFFNSSLAYVPFLRSHGPSVGTAWNAVTQLNLFLDSGYPFRGDSWGPWQMNVFNNQRHLASGISLLLIVLVFLFDRYRELVPKVEEAKATPADGEESAQLLAEEPGL